MKQSFSLVSSKQCDYSIIMLLSGTFLTAGAKSRKTFSFLKEPFINSTCGQCLQSVFAQSIQERNIGKLQINIGLRSESIIIMWVKFMFQIFSPDRFYFCLIDSPPSLVCGAPPVLPPLAMVLPPLGSPSPPVGHGAPPLGSCASSLRPWRSPSPSSPFGREALSVLPLIEHRGSTVAGEGAPRPKVVVAPRHDRQGELERIIIECVWTQTTKKQNSCWGWDSVVLRLSMWTRKLKTWWILVLASIKLEAIKKKEMRENASKQAKKTKWQTRTRTKKDRKREERTKQQRHNEKTETSKTQFHWNRWKLLHSMRRPMNSNDIKWKHIQRI